MNSRVIGFAFTVCLWSVPGSAFGVVLDYTPVAQDSRNLCWAAAAETAWSTQGVIKTKCKIVAAKLGAACCKSSGVVDIATQGCDAPTPFGNDYLPGVLKSRSRQVADPQDRNLRPLVNLVVGEIGAGRPVVAWWHYEAPCDRAGHVVVAVGYDDSAPPQVLVMDPRPGDAKLTTWSYFQCGPVGLGHCVVYHAMNGGQMIGGDLVDTLAPCVTTPVLDLERVGGALVAGLVAGRLPPEMAEPLGIPTGGPISCSDETIAVEFAGSIGVRHLLVECERGGSRFFAAVAPRTDESLELLWLGARELAKQIVAAKERVGFHGDRLVLQFFPESGEAMLYRRGGDPGVPLVKAPPG